MEVIISAVLAILLIYSMLRPFASNFSRFLLFFGSSFGLLSILGRNYIGTYASYLGIDSLFNLYVYIFFLLSLICFAYILDRFKKIEKKIDQLAQKEALQQIKKNK